MTHGLNGRHRGREGKSVCCVEMSVRVFVVMYIVGMSTKIFAEVAGEPGRYCAPHEDSKLCTFSLFVEFLSHTVG